MLIHLPLVPQICVSEWGQHWFRKWLVTYSVPNHYLNQCWIIINSTLRNTLQWNFNQNTHFLIHKNSSENVVCEMAAILSRARRVNPWSGGTKCIEDRPFPSTLDVLYAVKCPCTFKGSNMIVCVLLVSNSRGCCLAAPGDHEGAVIAPWRDNTLGSLTPTIHTQSCLIPIITWCHHFFHRNQYSAH